MLDRARALFGELETDEHLSAALGRVRDLLPAVVDDPDARRRLINEICRVRDDFLVADLRHADLEGAWLEGAWLEGVQGTTSTCWPAEWAEQIELDEVRKPFSHMFAASSSRHPFPTEIKYLSIE